MAISRWSGRFCSPSSSSVSIDSCLADSMKPQVLTISRSAVSALVARRWPAGEQQLLHGLGVDRVLGAAERDQVEAALSRCGQRRHVNSTTPVWVDGSCGLPLTVMSTALPLLTRMMTTFLPNGSARWVPAGTVSPITCWPSTDGLDVDRAVARNSTRMPSTTAVGEGLGATERRRERRRSVRGVGWDWARRAPAG